MENLNLKNKTILILGGSGLIGRQIVNSLSKLCKLVIVLDINVLKIRNKKIKFYNYDLSDNNFEKKFQIIINKYKKIDCYINCAYPVSENWNKCDYQNINKEDLSINLDLQLERLVLTTNIISKQMRKNKIKGSIVLMNSIYGILGYDMNVYKNTEMRENIAYSVIKGGITNYIRTMASILSKNGIRINSVCAGGVEGHIAGKTKNQSRQFIKNYSEKVPIGRLAKPKEISGPVIFLCSDLSSYITGSNLLVDGGWSSI